jgi:hypothetical protein
LTSSCSSPSSSANKPGVGNVLPVRLAHAVPNWQNLDLQKDGILGISTEKAYQELLKKKTATDVIVAVIDSGIDTTQQDLTPVLWTDPMDGSHGRNFIGPEAGKEDFIPMLASTTGRGGYGTILDDYTLHVSRLQTFIFQLKETQKILEQIIKNTGKERPSFEDLKIYRPQNESEAHVIDLVMDRISLYPNLEKLKFSEVDHLLDLAQYHLTHGLSQTVGCVEIRIWPWPSAMPSTMVRGSST